MEWEMRQHLRRMPSCSPSYRMSSAASPVRSESVSYIVFRFLTSFHYAAIASGYYLGTSLSPEAKTYRLLADVLNDAAILTDTLSPHLATLSLSPRFPFLVPTPAAGAASPLRIVALCASGALRALCGAVAGGSKAALTVHFASAGVRPGDLGDLNAKDGSKETVLALLGMLVRFH